MRAASTSSATSTYSSAWWGMSRWPGPHVTIGMPSCIRRIVPSVEPGTPPKMARRVDLARDGGLVRTGGEPHVEKRSGARRDHVGLLEALHRRARDRGRDG